MTALFVMAWVGCSGESTPPADPPPVPAPPVPPPAPAPSTPVRQQVQRLGTRLGEVERTSWLHVPDGTTPGAMPLVVLLHGGVLADGRRMAAQVDHWFDQGVVFLFPDGPLAAPGEGGKIGKKAAPPEPDEGAPIEPPWQRDDDLAFVEVVADQVARSYAIDRRRIYLAGFAEGGELALMVACSDSGSTTFAGFVSVAGAVPRDLACPAKGFPKPVLAVAGTEDEHALWTGDAEHLSATEGVGLFLPKDGCDPASAAEALLEDTDASDETRIERHSWTCTGSAVELLEVQGGGHTWPKRPGRVAPKTSRDVDAMDEIGRFFGLTRGAPAERPRHPVLAPRPPPAPAGKPGKRKHKSG